MASKKYQDEIAPASGRVYEIVPIPNGNTSRIMDVTEYEQVGSEFHAEDVNAACLLEADHAKSGTVHALTTPNVDTQNIKFRATAAYVKGDTFTLNGTACSAQTISGRPLESGYFKAGAMVRCLLSRGTLWFEGGAAPVLVDDTTGAVYLLGVKDGKLYIKEDE